MATSFLPSQYTRPTMTLQQSFLRRTARQVQIPRYVSVVARTGSNKLFRNARLLRAFLSDVPLTFNPLTGTTTLPHTAFPDKAQTRLSKLNGDAVPQSKWNFTTSAPNVYDGIVIDPSAFDSAESYIISYQSTDKTLARRPAAPPDDRRQPARLQPVRRRPRLPPALDFNADHVDPARSPRRHSHCDRRVGW